MSMSSTPSIEIMPSARPPLSGFRVLDLTRVRTGPTAVKQLADWGADVIKIERPGGDDMGGPRHGSDFQNLHRNKRSMTLNLKRPEALALFRRMAAHADVVVENYRPAVKHRLGVDYESLRSLNPRLVYASISGFGQEGPYRDRPGVDQIAQGLGGLMSVTGPEGAGVPLRVGIPIADLCGGLYCALGILTALLERERSGEGQWVRTSLLQAQVAMMDLQAMRWLMDGEIPEPIGNGHPTGSPTNAYRTRDGHVNVGASGGDLFDRFCRAIARPDLLEDPDYATEEAAHRNRHALDALIEARLRTETTAHWVEILNAAGVPLRAHTRHARRLRGSPGAPPRNDSGRRPPGARRHRPRGPRVRLEQKSDVRPECRAGTRGGYRCRSRRIWPRRGGSGATACERRDLRSNARHPDVEIHSPP